MIDRRDRVAIGGPGVMTSSTNLGADPGRRVICEDELATQKAQRPA